MWGSMQILLLGKRSLRTLSKHSLYGLLVLNFTLCVFLCSTSWTIAHR